MLVPPDPLEVTRLRRPGSPSHRTVCLQDLAVRLQSRQSRPVKADELVPLLAERLPDIAVCAYRAVFGIHPDLQETERSSNRRLHARGSVDGTEGRVAWRSASPRRRGPWYAGAPRPSGAAWPMVMAVRRYFPARRLAAIAWTRAATASSVGWNRVPAVRTSLSSSPAALASFSALALACAGGVRRGIHQDPAQVHHRIALAGAADVHPVVLQHPVGAARGGGLARVPPGGVVHLGTRPRRQRGEQPRRHPRGGQRRDEGDLPGGHRRRVGLRRSYGQFGRRFRI